MIEVIEGWFTGLGLGEAGINIASRTTAVAGLLVVAYLANLTTKRIILRAVRRLVEKTKTNWDDALVNRQLFTRLSHLAPALVISFAAPFVFQGSPELVAIAQRASEVYILLAGLLAASALLNAVGDVYQNFAISQRVPITGYIQIVKIALTVVIVILALSASLDKSPLVFFTGLGALTAVILLIFKDTILGFVGGVQLVVNDMVRPGDWIEMPKYGADGDVVEITLNTVKVRNWDKTISTIPTYALISDSFKNWRGMSESGGRRIKRSFHIDVNSIRFCTPEMVERFSKIQILRGYVEQKLEELAGYNLENNADETVLVNGRRMTNIGTFRAYLVAYLKSHPKIHQQMTLIVRQLQPTERGLQLEIYVFCNDQRWRPYEDIQADIFDHIFAALPEFDLRPFQNPTGSEIVMHYSLNKAGEGNPT